MYHVTAYASTQAHFFNLWKLKKITNPNINHGQRRKLTFFPHFSIPFIHSKYLFGVGCGICCENQSAALRSSHACKMAARGAIFVLIVFIQCFTSLADEHSHTYEDGEEVVLWMNTIGPYANRQETYNYFSLHFCQGKKEGINHYHERCFVCPF